MSQKTTGFAFATAAAAVFAAGVMMTPVAQAADKDMSVHCTGVNSCKGTSECSSAKNSCKGQNSCKGMGWISLTQTECTAAQAKAKSEGK